LIVPVSSVSSVIGVPLDFHRGSIYSDSVNQQVSCIFGLPTNTDQVNGTNDWQLDVRAGSVADPRQDALNNGWPSDGWMAAAGGQYVTASQDETSCALLWYQKDLEVIFVVREFADSAGCADIEVALIASLDGILSGLAQLVVSL